jgi:hypothetical protein
MRRFMALMILSGVLAMATPNEGTAQEAGSGLIAVGEMAPDFALPGATRYGLLEEPVRLSDYRGETIVLAFFFRVRTGG